MPTKLEQLRQMTLVVADTGDLNAIRQYQPTDATTNPSLLLQALDIPAYAPLLQQAANQSRHTGLPLYDTFAALLASQLQQQVPGYVSVEVDARTSFDEEASLQRAHQLIEQISRAGGDPSRILIKLASTWEGIRAAEKLEKEGISCNLTLLFGFDQARACADAGVTLISPFVGRILDWYKAQQPDADFSGHKDPGVMSVQQIYRYYKSRGYQTIVMGASFRNTSEIECLAGCDRLTIAPKLLAELEADSGDLQRVLHPDLPQEPADVELNEAAFRLALNQDAMATEKLAQGIRQFIKDLETLEQRLASL
ncbi:transaldolase [Marinospirillum alkaliphilum]|uniref:Transaldolase n=1 Tax=Marinospirillum alkaliphilum DSM 21637 TaxID=1122209 RepID=A0A1K1TZE9_9GAMM|nr:transaldolase [Marinospirillum alkaliphilum]SFX05896.1 transaldolase [Marinospirillum alkaliphilum DSM 21637]